MQDIIDNEGAIVAAQAVAARATSSVTPADLLRHALDSGADLDRLEKLMELQQKYEANEARKAFADDMARFKSRPLVIKKDNLVSYGEGKSKTEYMHATIGNVVDVIVPALAEFGFSHRWDLEQRDGQVIVTCVITHRLGHSQSTTLMAAPDSSGGKNGIQSVISAKTYLQRHTLLAATGAATMDQQDDDGGARFDTSLADKWIAKANAATALSVLNATWTEGIEEINQANDMRAYTEFKAAVAARKKELTEGAAK